MTNKAPVIAAIDVGTNSFHMVIASMNSRGILQIKSKDKEVVRLGSSSRDMKYIQPDAMERGINTIKNFSKIARSEKAEIRAVATSAVREALNKEEFLSRVKSETGVSVELVSGQEEGRLIYIGAVHALPILSNRTLVIDIGGGSTETIVGRDGEVKCVASEKLGAIRLTKRFFTEDVITDAQISDCRNHIIGEWFPTLRRLIQCEFDTSVGTSGTIMNIAAMAALRKKKNLPDILNGLSVSRDDLLSIINVILNARTVKERAAIPGMDPNRADIIVAGALILEQALIILNIQKLLVSVYALREGIVFDTIQKKKAIQEYPHLSHLRFETVYSLCKQYNINFAHAEHVKDITLKIFDDLEPIHKLGFQERELLEVASMLHDIGYTISHDQHHKHSYYIISHCVMPGFTNTESDIIANIARYHRKSHPKKKHENFAKLLPEQQETVKVLAGILRIAEGIDRRQMQLVKTVKTDFDDKEINIHLIPEPDRIKPDIELWGAERRKLLMEETLGRKIKFHLDESKPSDKE